VPLRGSLLLFVALTALFLVSAIGIGVLVAAVTRTLQQALLLSFFGLFPVMFLSGTLVPVESMPRVLQWAAQASPLLHYLEITLGIFLKGVGWSQLWPHALVLALSGGLLLLVAGWIFRRGTG
jgi:ABC-2 type transport system permease protein